MIEEFVISTHFIVKALADIDYPISKNELIETAGSRAVRVDWNETKNIKELILNGGTTAELKREAIKAGMDTLRVSGLKKVMQGLTTPEEVLRVTVGEEE